MLLRESLKRELDSLNEGQLSRIATLIRFMKAPNTNRTKTVALRQHVTPKERSQDLRTWIASLPNTGISLSDEAFDRKSIYE